MRACLLAATSLLIPVFSPLAQGDDATNDKEKFQGAWVWVSSERDGMPYTKEQMGNLKVVISNDTITFKLRKEVRFKFTLDRSKSPKTIDMTSKEEGMSVGIYTCEDDLLLLCVNARGGAERPKAFTTPRDPSVGFAMYLLKRVKE